MLRLHSLDYSDHLDDWGGRTAGRWLMTPSTTSGLCLAVDSLADQTRSVRKEQPQILCESWPWMMSKVWQIEVVLCTAVRHLQVSVSQGK